MWFEVSQAQYVSHIMISVFLHCAISVELLSSIIYFQYAKVSCTLVTISSSVSQAGHSFPFFLARCSQHKVISMPSLLLKDTAIYLNISFKMMIFCFSFRLPQ